MATSRPPPTTSVTRDAQAPPGGFSALGVSFLAYAEYTVIPVSVLAVPQFTSEYSAGLIRTTFAAVPQRWTVLAGKADLYNLHDIRAAFPLNAMTAVAGPSGAGKTALVLESLVPAVREAIAGREGTQAGPAVGRRRHPSAGRDRRDPDRPELAVHPATYSGAFDAIRQAFADTPLARSRGGSRGTSRSTPRPASARCASSTACSTAARPSSSSTTTCSPPPTTSSTWARPAATSSPPALPRRSQRTPAASPAPTWRATYSKAQIDHLERSRATLAPAARLRARLPSHKPS
jgi:hypothetical protein